MADYSDHYKDMQHEAFMREWAPSPEEMKRFSRDPDSLLELVRYNIDCRRKAEKELSDLRGALATVKRILK